MPSPSRGLEMGATMADVATTKVLDNERLTVWEMVLEPGQETGVHTHTHSYLLYVIEGSAVETVDANGNSLGTVEAKAGQAVYFRLVGRELFFDDMRLPVTHNARNVGSSRYREMLVEIK